MTNVSPWSWDAPEVFAWTSLVIARASCSLPLVAWPWHQLHQWHQWHLWHLWHWRGSRSRPAPVITLESSWHILPTCLAHNYKSSRGYLEYEWMPRDMWMETTLHTVHISKYYIYVCILIINIYENIHIINIIVFVYYCAYKHVYVYIYIYISVQLLCSFLSNPMYICMYYTNKLDKNSNIMNIICTCIYIYICVCVFISISIKIYICMHIYIHIHIVYIYKHI